MGRQLLGLLVATVVAISLMVTSVAGYSALREWLRRSDLVGKVAEGGGAFETVLPVFLVICSVLVADSLGKTISGTDDWRLSLACGLATTTTLLWHDGSLAKAEAWVIVPVIPAASFVGGVMNQCRPNWKRGFPEVKFQTFQDLGVLFMALSSADAEPTNRIGRWVSAGCIAILFGGFGVAMARASFKMLRNGYSEGDGYETPTLNQLAVFLILELGIAVVSLLAALKIVVGK